MAQKLSVREFFARFPDDAACLEHLMEVRYGLKHQCAACNKDKLEAERREWTFHRIKGRKAYSCANCGRRILPSRRDDFSGQPHLFAAVVLRNFPVRHDASRRQRYGDPSALQASQKRPAGVLANRSGS